MQAVARRANTVREQAVERPGADFMVLNGLIGSEGDGVDGLS